MTQKLKNAKTKVEVVHKNCTYNCKHCFVSATESASPEVSRETAQKLKDNGYDVSIWTSSMEKEGALKLRSEFGQWRSGNGDANCIVELRDTLPHYMDDAPDGSPLGFSLHGHTAQIHNLLVRDEDNFDRVVETLQEAHRRGLEKYFVNHVVHKKNYKHLADFTELMADLKVPHYRITKLVATPAVLENVPSLLMDPEEIHEVIRQANILREQYRGTVIVGVATFGFGALFTKKRYKLTTALCKLSPMQLRHHCQSGLEVFAVHAETKDVYPCRYFLNANEGKVGTMSDEGKLQFDQHSWKADFHQHISKIEEPCRSCGVLKWCGGGCRATATAEHAQYTGEWNPYAGLKSCPVAGGVFLEY